MFKRGLSLLAVLIVISICMPAPSGAQWYENGTPVCTAVNYQAWETAVPDGDGGAYVVRTDEREWPWAMLTAQHIGAGGFPSWNINGIQVSVEDTLQLQPTAAYAGDGTVVIILPDYDRASCPVLDDKGVRLNIGAGADRIARWQPGCVKLDGRGRKYHNSY